MSSTNELIYIYVSPVAYDNVRLNMWVKYVVVLWILVQNLILWEEAMHVIRYSDLEVTRREVDRYITILESLISEHQTMPFRCGIHLISKINVLTILMFHENFDYV